MIISELPTIDINKINELSFNKNAFLFDMDGTILNSEPIHLEAFNKICPTEAGLTLENVYGVSDFDIFHRVQSLLKYDFNTFLDLKNKHLIELIKGYEISKIFNYKIIELLDSLSPKKLALVTASEDVITKLLLKQCEVTKYFETVITRQSVKETKPSPEPYLLALSMLNVSKEDALIFEDSPTGIEAANRASIDTIKVTWYENF